MSDDVIAEVRNPEGRRVLVLARHWRHVLEEHAEMFGYLQEVMGTIESPDHREPDPAPGRERYFRRGGPQGWIRVVTEFAGRADRLVTAFPQIAGPKGRIE